MTTLTQLLDIAPFREHNLTEEQAFNLKKRIGYTTVAKKSVPYNDYYFIHSVALALSEVLPDNSGMLYSITLFENDSKPLTILVTFNDGEAFKIAKIKSDLFLVTNFEKPIDNQREAVFNFKKQINYKTNIIRPFDHYTKMYYQTLQKDSDPLEFKVLKQRCFEANHIINPKPKSPTTLNIRTINMIISPDSKGNLATVKKNLGYSTINKEEISYEDYRLIKVATSLVTSNLPNTFIADSSINIQEPNKTDLTVLITVPKVGEFLFTRERKDDSDLFNFKLNSSINYEVENKVLVVLARDVAKTLNRITGYGEVKSPFKDIVPEDKKHTLNTLALKQRDMLS